MPSFAPFEVVSEIGCAETVDGPGDVDATLEYVGKQLRFTAD